MVAVDSSKAGGLCLAMFLLRVSEFVSVPFHSFLFRQTQVDQRWSSDPKHL